MKQHESVKQVMKANGGYATLGFLYVNVDITGWKTNTPFASIRRIVQDDRFFFKIRPGLWALKEYEKDVLDKFNITKKSAKESVEEFNHSYYQGLLIEIGNLEGYETFIPSQDKNKKYLNKPLYELTSIKEFYPFTYPEVMRRAITIDVSWFNERKYPASFFEIEHTTDFNNSLLKFMELQDFSVKFNIVADKSRETKFINKISSSTFFPIVKKVKFIDYNSLAILHAKISELTAIKTQIKI